jgi:hypothetical protein
MMMAHRLLRAGIVVFAIATATGAPAQPFVEGAALRLVAAANSLAARIRAFHHWRGLTPPPADYCNVMREGEAVQKELARLASRAILFRRPGLALSLQAAGDRLSDELDFEEETNQQAQVPFREYPCPAPPPPYPARAYVLIVVAQRMPACRLKANVLRVSFEARRALMQQCLRIPGT